MYKRQHIKIPVHVKVSESIILEIFNMKGRKIKSLKDLYLHPGEHEFQWDAVDHPSGIYFFKLSSNSHSSTKKAILIK